jgi:hypothetical protein
MSVKRFVAALDRSGLGQTPLRRWLNEYGEPGQHGRTSFGEDRLRIAYSRDHELAHLEFICQLAGVDPLDIAAASDAARTAAKTSAQGRIFRAQFSWPTIADGLRSYVESFEAHVGIDLARRMQREAEEAFRQSTMPGETEAMELAKRRIGQDLFRELLLQYWKGRCPMSGIDDRRLLRASHIKPWAESNDDERLNPFNGILLSANLDTAFDAGLISFSNAGTVLRSQSISDDNFIALGIPSDARLFLTPEHAEFLPWHRRVHGYTAEQ